MALTCRVEEPSTASIGDIARLFDHLVGAGEQRGGTSRPSALAVLRLITSSNLVGCLNRQVGGLLALKDAVDVAAGMPILIDRIVPI